MKRIYKIATIWTIIYFVITMLIFSLAGYFICTNFDSNNILFCVLVSFITLIVSLSIGSVIFVIVYKLTNYYIKQRKRRH